LLFERTFYSSYREDREQPDVKRSAQNAASHFVSNRFIWRYVRHGIFALACVALVSAKLQNILSKFISILFLHAKYTIFSFLRNKIKTLFKKNTTYVDRGLTFGKGGSVNEVRVIIVQHQRACQNSLELEHETEVLKRRRQLPAKQFL
jgi:hypothetical protein